MFVLRNYLRTAQSDCCAQETTEQTNDPHDRNKTCEKDWSIWYEFQVAIVALHDPPTDIRHSFSQRISISFNLTVKHINIKVDAKSRFIASLSIVFQKVTDSFVTVRWTNDRRHFLSFPYWRAS